MSIWIPISERLPDDDRDVLVTDGETYNTGYWRDDAKAFDNTEFGWLEARMGPITHWMDFSKYIPLKHNYEDVVKGLQECIKNDRECRYDKTCCPYVEECRKHGRSALKADALALLRKLKGDAE